MWSGFIYSKGARGPQSTTPEGRGGGRQTSFSKRVAVAGDFKTCDNSGPAGGRTAPPVRALLFGDTHIPPVWAGASFYGAKAHPGRYSRPV